MRTLYQPMYRLETADHDIVSDWFYSQSECIGNNEFNAFEITKGLVEHIIIDSIPYPCDVIDDNQLFFLTYEDNETSVHLKENETMTTETNPSEYVAIIKGIRTISVLAVDYEDAKNKLMIELGKLNKTYKETWIAEGCQIQ